MKKITKKWLTDRNACEDSLNHVIKNNYIDLKIDKFLEKLMENDRFPDANWLITKYMNKKQCVLYAIFAAEQVLHIFEDKYPEDKRPRKAIETAKAYLVNPCKQTKDAADATAATAADAAGASSASSAYVATAAAATAAAYASSASSASSATDAYAADATATAAGAASSATYYAYGAYGAYGAYADADAAKKEMQTKIIENGIKIIKGE